jgi:DUF1009 family protein
MCAREAGRRGMSIFVVAHHGETDPLVDSLADKVRWVHLGQLGAMIKFFRKNRVSEIIFAGSITKKRIFRDIRPDLRGIKLWNRIDKRLDDGILRAVAHEFEQEGIMVRPSTMLLEDLVVEKRCYTRKRPDRTQLRDMEIGMELAREIGRLDIGQCVVIKDRVVLAVEAIEGTDRTISRAGELGGRGAVVVKVCKPSQDRRFDLPSIGIGTVETMIEAGAEVLAVEAGSALFFDRDMATDLADRSGIVITGV